MKCPSRLPGAWGVLSHPARGGWIEISVSVTWNSSIHVPPRKGWVD